MSELGRRNKRLSKPGELIVGIGGGRNTVVPSKSTKLLHVLADYIEDYREVSVEAFDRFTKGKLELSDGEVIENQEYLETYFKVTVYLKPFTIFGKEFRLKYTYNTDYRRSLTLDYSGPRFSYYINGKQVSPKEFFKDQDKRRKHHIKNKEVTKEEYDKYLKSKESNDEQ